MLSRFQCIVFLAMLSYACMVASEPLQYTGVSLAGAEFGAGRELPGQHGRDYIYPNQKELDYFAGRGMNIVRLPFLWERLQPELHGPFDADEFDRLDSFVRATIAKDVTVILDPHNYAGYRGKKVGSDTVPHAAFAGFWARLAKRYADEPKVWFGLMNEPTGLPGAQWLDAANTAIAAIRDSGAKNRILVPGVAYSGAHSWHSDWYGTPNAETMKGIVDRADNFLIEVHQYLDEDSSGRSDNAVSETIGSKRCEKFTAWCRAHGYHAFLGEFDAGNNATGRAALTDMLVYLEENGDVWEGWTYWAAGPWWRPDGRKIEPRDGQDQPMLQVLEPHLQPR